MRGLATLRDFLIIERLLVGVLALDVVSHIDSVVVHLLGLLCTIRLGTHTRVFGIAGLELVFQLIMLNLPPLRVGIHTGLVFVLLSVRTILGNGRNRHEQQQNQ